MKTSNPSVPSDPSLLRIQTRLRGKRIYVLPYTHADYAWVHARDWHVRRYHAVFGRVLELLRKEKDFTFFFDSWSELLQPCLQTYRREIPFVRQMLREERLAVAGGQWANLRFPHVGDETSIRNLVLGRRAVAALFPEARLEAYANLDIGIGHSQIPQLLKLAGYRSYLAYRPLNGLDRQGVPRTFWWEGLSGDRALVSRMSYTGWWHAPEFYPAPYDLKHWTENFPHWEAARFEVDHAVKWAWTHYLEKPAAQRGLQTLAFFQGHDDSLPLTDACTGVRRDLGALMHAWTVAGYGDIRFGTPNDYFDALARQKPAVPVWRGLLDPTDVGYNIAWHGRKGLWWLRELGDRELVLAEQLATRASLLGARYPERELQAGWQDLLTHCAHANEFLLDEGFAEARRTLEGTIALARQIQARSLGVLGRWNAHGRVDGFAVFNPLPEPRREIVRFRIPRTDAKPLVPLLRDGRNKPLPTQVLSGAKYDGDFELLAEMDLAAGGCEAVRVAWAADGIAPVPPAVVAEGRETRVESDSVRLVFRDGLLVTASARPGGSTPRAREGVSLLEPLLYKVKLRGGWMPLAHSEHPERFKVERLEVEESGPLRWRVVRYGQVGRCPVVQEIDLVRGCPEVAVRTQVDIVRQAVVVALGMPLGAGARLTTDIPFGVEPRDLSKIVYGQADGFEWSNIERIIPGVFWGRSWVFAEDGLRSYGLLSVDGGKMYRRTGRPGGLLHFLANMGADRRQGWLRGLDQARALGRHAFQHRLVLACQDWRGAGMPVRSQQARTPPLVWAGAPRKSMPTLRLEPANVRLSALYREGRDVLCRMVNLQDRPATASLHLPFPIRAAEAVDFLGRPLPTKPRVNNDQVKATLKPWQVLTLRLSPR